MTLKEVRPAATVQNRGTSRLTATGGVSHSRGCKPGALGLLDPPALKPLSIRTVGEFMIFKKSKLLAFLSKNWS